MPSSRRSSRFARRLVDEIPSSGEADLVPTLTVPLPVTVIAGMLGIPPEDRGDFKRWSDDIMINGVYGRDGIATLPEFHAYLDAQIEARRATSDPPDDLLTRLVHAEIDGARLNPREIRTQVRFLVMAGNETTTNLIGNTLYELLRRPGLWARWPRPWAGARRRGGDLALQRAGPVPSPHLRCRHRRGRHRDRPGTASARGPREREP